MTTSSTQAELDAGCVFSMGAISCAVILQLLLTQNIADVLSRMQAAHIPGHVMRCLGSNMHGVAVAALCMQLLMQAVHEAAWPAGVSTGCAFTQACIMVMRWLPG